MGKEAWLVQFVIEGEAAEVSAAVDGMAQVLCADDGHDGSCPMPWTAITTRLADLDPADRQGWQDLLDA